MENKKEKMMSAIRLWAVTQGMEETTNYERYNFWTDISFKKGEEIIGFITEFDRDDDALKTKMVFSKELCNRIYIVTDDSKKRRELAKKIMKGCGILCYSDSFGLGMTYQVLKEPA